MNKIITNLFSYSTLAMAVTSPLQAQQLDSEENKQWLEEVIVVAAQKREERLQDVTSMVDVVQGDTIEKLNLKTFSDIEQLSPGLSLTSQEPNVNSITLRGVGFNPNSASAPTVDIYFNETPLDTNSAFRALYDIAQIEVLRGPQGTLRGRTSPSGAITIATRRANVEEIEGYFQQTLTDQNGVNSQGAISLPLVEDVLAVRLAGLYDKNEGLGAYNIRTGDDDKDETTSLRANIIYYPMDDLMLDLTYQYLDNSSEATPILLTLPGRITDPILKPEDRKGKTTYPATYDYTGHLVSFAITLELEDMSLDYIGGFQDIEQGRAADLAYGGTIENFSKPQAFVSSTKSTTHEFRVTSQGDGFWDYLYGIYLEDSESQTDLTQAQYLPFGFVSGANPPLDIAVLAVGVDIPSDVKTYAAFTDYRFHITEQDQFQIGIRYQKTDVKRDFVQTISGPLLGPVPLVSSAIGEDQREVTYDQVTGGMSFRHEFTPDLTAYVSYGRSYRPGGVVATTAALDEDLIIYDAETSDNYEVGLKGNLFEGRAMFSVAVYQQDFDNYLAYTDSFLSVSTGKDGVTDNSVAFTFNADAQVRGIEANIIAKASEQLRVGLSATYNEAKFKGSMAPCNDYNGDGVADSNGAPNVPVGQNVAMCRLSGTVSAQADWSVSLNAEYTTPFKTGELFARGLLSYSPDRNDPFQDLDFDSLLTNSIFLGYRSGDSLYEVSLFGKNLTNDDTLTTANAGQVDYDLFDTGYAVATPVRPREFGLIVTTRF
ncbi:MAG: TonB-dependent receptor [Spongiibacteraceae bacterium]|nr:TonB-dependent receptor [Spongiibacteraceae bacterium]MBN4055477.1 TonB-dependent receptor [bacterium AH-315-K03]